MVAALVLAVLTSATPSPSPLPVIITTKSSPICQALREKIAPVLARLTYEDRLMQPQRPGGTSLVAIDALALNWIETNKLLNPDTFFHSDNPEEEQRMEALRQGLQKVADDENNALNVLSGAYYTGALEGLMASGPKTLGNTFPAELTPGGIPEIAYDYGQLEVNFLQRQQHTQQDELPIAAALQPLIVQCKEPNASP
jgi:hypothetical protein